MKIRLETPCSLIGFAALALPAAAQWPSYPTPNVPRNADGKVNTHCTGPAHRGRQTRSHGTVGDLLQLDRGGSAARRSEPVALAARLRGEPGRQPARPDRRHTAARSERAAARDVLRHRRQHPRRPAVSAVGQGPARAAHGRQSEGQPRRELFADGLHAAALASAAAQDRPDARAHRDHVRGQPGLAADLHGRPRAAEGRRQPAAVVVRLFGRPLGRRHARRRIGRLPSRTAGSTCSAARSRTQGKLTERWRRPDYGHLEIDVTVDDPKAYTKPFTVRVSHQLTVDQELIEFICNENEKSARHYDP